MRSDEGVVDEEVDKKIEATLPRAEQSTIARSRKSSYMLRIFDKAEPGEEVKQDDTCLLYTSPSPRDGLLSRMPSSA